MSIENKLKALASIDGTFGLVLLELIFAGCLFNEFVNFYENKGAKSIKQPDTLQITSDSSARPLRPYQYRIH